MNTVGELNNELKKILAGVDSDEFGNADQGLVEKLEKLSSAAAALDMKTGKGLIDNFTSVLKTFLEGKSNAGSVSLRFTALDFYQKNVLSAHQDGAVEDL